MTQTFGEWVREMDINDRYEVDLAIDEVTEPVFEVIGETVAYQDENGNVVFETPGLSLDQTLHDLVEYRAILHAQAREVTRSIDSIRHELGYLHLAIEHTIEEGNGEEG
jgi:hypothetical protein